MSNISHNALFRVVAAMLAMAIGMTLPARAVSPLIRNFSSKEYDAGSQNWAVDQDADGIVYFGNNYGLLSFDSRSWNVSGLANGSTVRSVFADKETRRIYAGGSDEFGYFERNPHGFRLDYRSLMPTLSSRDTELHEVWAIFKHDGKIHFVADHKIVVYDGKNSVVYPVKGKIVASALIGDALCFATEDGRLGRLAAGEMSYLECTVPDGAKICSIFNHNGVMAVMTASHGLYHYSGSRLVRHDLPVDGLLENAQVFCATTNGSDMAFGTVNRGVIIVREQDGRFITVTKDDGLQNNTVLNLRFDDLGNLWLGLDNGIGYVMCNSPFFSLLGMTTPYGAGYASLLSAGRLYLGTNQGLYSMPYSYGQQIRANDSDSPEISGQVWNIRKMGDDIFVCCDGGLYRRAGDGFVQISGVGGCFDVCAAPGNADRLIVSGYGGFMVVERSGGGWALSHHIGGYSDVGGRFVLDASRHIWIPHWLKGLYRLTLSPDSRRFTDVRLYNDKNGLASFRNIGIGSLGGRPVFSTEDGIFTPGGKGVVADAELDTIFPQKGSAHLYTSPGGDIWMLSPLYVSVARKAGARYDVDSLSFSYLKDNMIAGFDNISFIDDDRMIYSNRDGFYLIDASHRNPQRDGRLLLTLTSADSVVAARHPVVRSDDKLTIGYGLNTLRIELLLPEYRAEKAVHYSMMLEGVDDDWTPLSPRADRDYLDLHEGDYTLHLRALDTYTGQRIETAMMLEILPPLWRRWWAYAIYIMIAVAAGWYGYKAFGRLSQRAALRVQRSKEREMAEIQEANRRQALEKDYEIARLKSVQLEQDVEHKSAELTSTTMNLVRTNQLLQTIAGRLEEIDNGANPEIKKLRAIIRESISKNDDWNKFDRHFDGVYHGFLKRLRELHPSLTQGDLRMCAYLKMGLSSKEIAPLLNISPRSVEMSRYRLRRKLGLARETSLSAYLDSLS